MHEKCFRIIVLVLAAMIPFELRFAPLGLSNLQWTFVLALAAGLPLVFQQRWRLLTNATILAALFVASQWVAVLLAPDFFTNAAKAAVRVTVGFILMTIVVISKDKDALLRIWAVSAVAAASYSLIAYAGFGVPTLFRTEEFYRGPVQRLSGSFDYPNTAAIFFAMSLPVVWMALSSPTARYAGAALLWMALLLTQSRGGIVAVATVAAVALVGQPADSISSGTRLKVTVAIVVSCLLIYLVVAYWSAPLGARYELRANRLHLRPSEVHQAEITIWNTGKARWPVEGRRKVGLAYRWFDIDHGVFLAQDPIRTELAESVVDGQRVSMKAAFRTPRDSGKFLLVWELFRGDLDWFSRTGIIPALAEVDIASDAERWSGTADLSRWYKMGGSDPKELNASVARGELWTAATQMFRENPVLGSGPDNFRLRYGEYLGHSKWDTSVRANNLYLEILVGSGVIGLLAFLAMMASRNWTFNPVSLALVIFLVHGLVDVFLMTTPIYFGFWILMGLSHGPQEATS
jgi:hypothetical protein